MLTNLHQEIATTKITSKITFTLTFRNQKTSFDSLLTKYIAQIETKTGKFITKFELKRSCIHASWDIFPFTIIIKTEFSILIDYEKTIIEKPVLIFYSDGSGIKNHINAAVMNPNLKTVQSKYLKTASKYTIYNAKLINIILILKMIINFENDHSNVLVRIYVDN